MSPPRLVSVALAVFLAAGCSASPPLQPAAANAGGRTGSVDFMRLLSPPPDSASVAARSEIERMLAIQESRTPDQGERARADAEMSIARFADALGSPAALGALRQPHVVALFARVQNEEMAAVGRAKDGFGRVRPCRVEPRIEPVLPCPSTASYPSGHAGFGSAAGLVLADLVPERRAQILARGAEYGWNRVVAGLHYPSDVEAGRTAGVVIAAFLFDSPEFRSEEAAARAELRPALGLPASVPPG